MRILDFAESPAAAMAVLNRPYESASKGLASVADILANVEARGDEALGAYTKAFDKADVPSSSLPVSAEEVQAAYSQVGEDLVRAIRVAKVNLEEFHKRQMKQSWFMTADDGIVLGHRYVPIERVGIYAPGGTAPLGSSLLMCAVPARVAGVSEVCVVTPPRPDGSISPYILVAAAECGISEIYRVGGPWAIGALAFGTPSIPRVDKIVGPGNLYVSLAKKLVYGRVGIDGLYGPSEIVVVADDSADAGYIAADLLSQAEHGTTSAAILLTPSVDLALRVGLEVERQLALLDRSAIARESVDSCGAIVVTRDVEEAVRLSNECAPEHVELLVENPWGWLGAITRAGAVFLGPYSTEPIGDYVAGTNHSLPTNGTARFSSGLGVDDFVLRHSVISYTMEGLRHYGPHGIRLAEEEGLTAHAGSIKARLDKEGY